MKRKGKIIPNGVVLREHEYNTVLFLTELGMDVELVPKSNKPGEHTPDIKMLGLFWEMKAPKGEGKYLIQNTLHKAAKQSENVIIDLRRIKVYQAKCLVELKKHFFVTSKRLKRMKVITKQSKVIDFKK